MPINRCAVAVCLVLAGAPLGAQNVRSPDSITVGRDSVRVTATALRPNAAAALARAQLGVERFAVQPPVPVPAGGGLSKSEAMMVVGGAALIVGALIGHDEGTIIMVGGAVVGLIGLWKWLQ